MGAQAVGRVPRPDFDLTRGARHGPNRGASMLPPVLFVPPKDAQRRQSIDGPYLVTISSKKVLAAPSRDRLRNCARPPCPFRTTAAAAGRCHRLARVWLCLDCAAPAPSNAQVQMPPTRAGRLEDKVSIARSHKAAQASQLARETQTKKKARTPNKQTNKQTKIQEGENKYMVSRRSRGRIVQRQLDFTKKKQKRVSIVPLVDVSARRKSEVVGPD